MEYSIWKFVNQCWLDVSSDSYRDFLSMLLYFSLYQDFTSISRTNPRGRRGKGNARHEKGMIFNRLSGIDASYRHSTLSHTYIYVNNHFLK